MENLKVKELEREPETLAEITLNYTKKVQAMRSKYLEEAISCVIPGTEAILANIMYSDIMDDRYTYLLRETARCIKALNSNEKIEVVYQSLPASLLPQRAKIIDLLVNFCTRGSDLKKYADIKAQEEFVNEFMKLLEQSEWQKEKAFNIRMAKNYDGREWRDLMPEAMLITKLNLIIRNCINNDIVNKLEGNAKRCVDIYCDVMLQEMSKEVKKAVKKVIYEGMLDDYWIPASKKRGNGSTNERHILIKKSISECFLNRNEISEEYISLYSIIAETLINNKKFNRLNVKLDCSK